MAVGLAALFLLSVFATTGPGITWDEPAYVAGGYQYVLWLRRPRIETIDQYWVVNHEHPPAAKLVYGVLASLEAGHTLLALLTARIGAALLFTILAGLTYAFTARYFGRPTGALAGLSLVLMPRVFGHGHLAGLDMPVSLACLAVVAAFARIESGRRWAVLAGALWGVALLTKLNAIFLPVLLIPWAMWVFHKKAAGPCLLFLATGAVVFFLGWPWLWPQPVERTLNYALDKAERLEPNGLHRPDRPTSVPVHYLGRTYHDRPAPWHYPLVLTLVTVPAGLLVFAGIGCRAAWKARTRVEVLVLGGGLLHLLVFVIPSVPKYDGVRLFLPAFPFIACLAGIGAAGVWRWRGRAGQGIVCAVFVLAAGMLVWTHPHELAYYNGLVGWAPGARALGFETTYWGGTINARVMAEVNELCPEGSTLAVWPPYMHMAKDELDALPWMGPGLHWDKEWRPGMPTPDFLLVFERQGYIGEGTRQLMGQGTMLREWTYLGVPHTRLIQMR